MSAIAEVLQVAELETVQGLAKRAPDWLVRLIYWMHDQQVAIITFNYDTLLEKTFHEIVVAELGARLAPVRLNPRALYPIRFPIHPYEQTFAMDWPTAELLKLHGSVNWFYSGAAEFFGEPIEYVPPKPWASSTDFLARRNDKLPLIAPPLADKSAHFSHESLRYLWRTARNRLQQAERVYCIGFGFPYTDVPVNFLLTESRGPHQKDFFLIDVDERVGERVKALLPKHFNLRLDFFGSNWTAKLPDFLWSIRPPERGTDSNPEATDKLRCWCRHRLREGGDLQCVRSQPGVYLISEVSEYGVTIIDRQIRVPYHLTWKALRKVIDQVRTSGMLPIWRLEPKYDAVSVESLLGPWYGRACGRVAASLLAQAEVVSIVDDTYIGGLKESFARSAP
ncbi:MAG: hypothetical protein IRZ15_03870 [Bryobacteraceae bacterium]|nr:hypothetical protein [Bryobacteraceae bacterium]